MEIALFCDGRTTLKRPRKRLVVGQSLNLCHLSTAKGQIISKGFLMSSISSIKRMKEFDFTTMIPQVDLFSFVFLEEIADTK